MLIKSKSDNKKDIITNNFAIFLGVYPRVKSTIVSFSLDRLNRDMHRAIKKVTGSV
jgi:hypothetical protein